MTLGLLILQCAIGALIPYTLSDPIINAYIIIAHFGVSGLVIIGTGFTWVHGWRGEQAAPALPVRMHQERNKQTATNQHSPHE